MNRKKFIQNSSLASLPLLLPSILRANESLIKLPGSEKEEEWMPLSKVTFSPTEKELLAVKKSGFKKYISEQLKASAQDDKSVQKRLSELKLDIKYTYNGNKVDEWRPVTFIDKNPLYCYQNFLKIRDIGWQEWIRPAMEVSAANWIRAVYSPWQLKEMMVNFWHNHFNVTVNADMPMGSFMPAYDRDVIRKHVFGNFRELLGAVAKSPAMLTYLNNKSSQASPANENYARELFELHTLGQDHYFNNLYDKWKDVPGALDGKPIGYIDEDVYEAARAFTGWTIADGTVLWRSGVKEELPATGDFYYFDGWHDNYQKRVLGYEIGSNMPALYDGNKVLDLLAEHPGTAKHICSKILIRFMGENFPVTVLNKAVDIWMKNLHSPEQIKFTLQAIFHSPDFVAFSGTKVKTPFEFIVSVARATDASFTPNTTLQWVTMGMGYKPFMWPAPNGHPDQDVAWMGPGAIISRWKATETIMKWKEFGVFKFSLLESTPQGLSYEKIIDWWSKKIIGTTLQAEVKMQLAKGLAGSELTSAIPSQNKIIMETQLKSLVQFLIATPDFQCR